MYCLFEDTVTMHGTMAALNRTSHDRNFDMGHGTCTIDRCLPRGSLSSGDRGRRNSPLSCHRHQVLDRVAHCHQARGRCWCEFAARSRVRTGRLGAHRRVRLRTGVARGQTVRAHVRVCCSGRPSPPVELAWRLVFNQFW